MAKKSFADRFDSQAGKLKSLFYSIYQQHPDADRQFGELLEIIQRAYAARPGWLIEQAREDPRWYLSNQLTGMMLYVDLFAGDLNSIREKIPYLAELGISYLHFMPLLQAREGPNDGGYAVADYLQVDPRFGTIAQFAELVHELRQQGIRTCIDYVVNHTAKEHEWARRAMAGDKVCQDMYFMYDTAEIPAEFAKTVPEVFPKVAPGNFTYYESIGKWVFTSFYEFQWDLNYHNPLVFCKMAEILLYLANTGVSAIRLDAIPFMWKELGTNCRNLAAVHTLLRLFRIITSIVCPEVILKGEAIVEPQQIVKYFGGENEEECQVLYNAAHMVNIWNTLATRDARLMALSARNAPAVPGGACWINYARCHDDIGWGLNNTGLQQLGFNPDLHKQFLINFYRGSQAASFARGELYEFNPDTMDARNSGTLASLCGLEAALENRDEYQRELAIKRILLIHGQLLAESGIPVIYSGDELAALNDWSYRQDPAKNGDSRWLHRSRFDWANAGRRNDLGTPAGQVFQKIKSLIALRKADDIFRSDVQLRIIECYDRPIYSFVKYLGSRCLVFVGNYCEDRQWVQAEAFNRVGIFGKKTDLIQGRTVDFSQDKILLGPYEFFWLMGSI